MLVSRRDSFPPFQDPGSIVDPRAATRIGSVSRGFRAARETAAVAVAWAPFARA